MARNGTRPGGLLVVEHAAGGAAGRGTRPEPRTDREGSRRRRRLSRPWPRRPRPGSTPFSARIRQHGCGGGAAHGHLRRGRRRRTRLRSPGCCCNRGNAPAGCPTPYAGCARRWRISPPSPLSLGDATVRDVDGARDRFQQRRRQSPGCRHGLAKRLVLDMVLDAGDEGPLLIGSLPDDGDVYFLVLCRLDGAACPLRRIMMVSLLHRAEALAKKAGR